MSKQWFTTAELAQMGLIGLPNAQNRIAEIAKSQKWNERLSQIGEPLARKRQARGGGFEYHVDLFPLATQADLKNRLKEPSKKVLSHSEKSDWTWFDGQNEKTKLEAYTRLNIINKIDEYRRNMTLTRAIEIVSIEVDVSVATLWVWWGMIEGVAVSDRIVALAPRRQGGGVKAEIHEDVWQIFISDFLRPSHPTYAGSYQRTKIWADANGLPVPHIKTFIRRLNKTISKDVIIQKRFGDKALEERLPSQRRTTDNLHALQALNIDGHKWNVMVKFPAKNGMPERIKRATSIVIQDIYSRKILAWRTDESESMEATQLVFADLFRNFGIPEKVTSDNGMTFASKKMTGGAKSRFRNKIKETDPEGMLIALGIDAKFTRVARGQSKPIERGFGDIQEYVTKHPICEGSFTGINPKDKPENSKKSVDLDVFEKLIDEQIEIHNSKIGRRGYGLNGKSFDQKFFESYEASPIRKATEEQIRFALLSSEQLRAHRKTGEINWDKNRYWAPELKDFAGEMLTIKFDDADYTLPISVYKTTGEFICNADLIGDVAFYDAESAKAHGKLRAEHKKATRRKAELENILSHQKLAKALETKKQDSAEIPSPKVIRPIQLRPSRGQSAVRKVEQEEFQNHLDDAIASLRTASQSNEQTIFTVFEGGLAPKNGGNAT